jgi:hypothetical protein
MVDLSHGLRRQTGNCEVERAVQGTGPPRLLDPTLKRWAWSLGILLAEIEPIPKGLYHSAQGCERRATLGAHDEMNRLPCKGCITSRPMHSPSDAAIMGEDSRAYHLLHQYEVAYDERYVWD